jgi:D-glycero-alpha-D-manno-heptose-7-phosphate kinase
MVIIKTPMRVSIIGGGTDYPSYYKKNDYGCVISIAIDVYVYVIVKNRRDSDIAINWSQHERVTEVDEIKHELIREAMRLLRISDGIEITTISDIDSQGSGLGSSSAVLVGVLNALHAYKGDVDITPERLAVEATYIEQQILHKPIGLQDAWPCAIGGINYYRFYPNDDCVHYPVDIAIDELVLFKCGLARQSDEICAQTGENAEANNKILNEMKYATEDLAKGMIKLRYALAQGWELKKQLCENISNPTVDKHVKALQTSGAWACKLCGSGASGYILACTNPKNHNFLRGMTPLQCLPINVSKGSEIIYNG